MCLEGGGETDASVFPDSLAEDAYFLDAEGRGSKRAGLVEKHVAGARHAFEGVFPVHDYAQPSQARRCAGQRGRRCEGQGTGTADDQH